MRIAVIGGTGFIGRQLVGRLSSASHAVQVPTRRYGRGRDLQILPGVTVRIANVNDDHALDTVIHGQDVVINLAGVLHSRRGSPYGPEFAQTHVELPYRIAQTCRRHDVKRLIHISALGASINGPSMYLRSKGEGEGVIQKVFHEWHERGWTIFRPSVVFGAEDQFTMMFARLARCLPVLPLAKARVCMQPVYVGDVVSAVVNVLDDTSSYQKIYPLLGPQVYTLGEIAQLCAAWSGHPRPVIALSDGLARAQATFMACLPGRPLITRDNLDSMKNDNVSSEPMAQTLRIVPTGLESVAPHYLQRSMRRFPT